MDTEATNWARTEFKHARLGDARRSERLIKLAAQRGGQPNASIPQSCGSKAAAKAAYRFYGNDAIVNSRALDSHKQATKERAASEKVVLAVQDTTELDYTNHPAMKGTGYLRRPDDHGLLLHDTMLVTKDRVPLGIINRQLWARPLEEFGKHRQRKQLLTSEKESQVWLTSLLATAELQKQLPDTRLVNVGDRDADIYDLFLLAEDLHQDLLVRACRDRRVDHPEQYLWPHLESRPVAGTITVTVPRKEKQPSRQASLTVRYGQVTLRPPRDRQSEHLKCITIWAVLVQEENPPAGVEPISWLLLTTVRVDSFEDACERVAWYACRWVIEMYHKVLKSGCRVEERQFDDTKPLERYLVIDSVIAWRVLYMTMLGREVPDMPCTAILEAHEWQALYCFIKQTNRPPAEPPSLREVTLWIAQLGGYIGREKDGPPGTIVMWRGLQRLHDVAAAWLIFRCPNPP